MKMRRNEQTTIHPQTMTAGPPVFYVRGSASKYLIRQKTRTKPYKNNDEIPVMTDIIEKET
jgi:hypothetical protein